MLPRTASEIRSPGEDSGYVVLDDALHGCL
jgi:hypothetical protein